MMAWRETAAERLPDVGSQHLYVGEFRCRCVAAQHRLVRELECGDRDCAGSRGPLRPQSLGLFWNGFRSSSRSVGSRYMDRDHALVQR